MPKGHRNRFRNPSNCVIFPRIIVCVQGHQIRIGLQDAYRSEESVYDPRLGTPLLEAEIVRGAYSFRYTIGHVIGYTVREDDTSRIRETLAGIFSQYPQHPIVVIHKKDMKDPEKPLLQVLP